MAGASNNRSQLTPASFAQRFASTAAAQPAARGPRGGALLAALYARLADKDALLAAEAKAHARELAAAKHATDVAKNRLNVCSSLETSIHEA